MSSPASNGPAPDDTDMLDASSPAMPPSSDVPEGPVDDSELNVIDEFAIGDEPVIAPDEVVESDGEELIHGDMKQDYVPIAELDVYEDEGLDNERYGEMEAGQRFEAERRMRAREYQEARRRGVHRPRALRSASPGADDERDRDYVRDLEADRRRRVAERAATGVYGDDGDAPVPNIETYHGPLRDWLTNDAVRRELKRRFRQFLQTYGTAGEFTERRALMMERIFSMCEKNGESLHINYTILSDNVPILAVWLVDEPKTTLPILDEVAMELVSETFQGYRENIHDEIHVRIEGLPLDDNIRDLRQVHLNGLIKVKGVITRRSTVFPQLKLARYNCVKCNFLTAPVVQTGEQEAKPNASCPNCQSRGPFIVNDTQTVYRNFQRITVQETPGTVPAGRIPRHREVIMTNDLIDFARPGDEIEVTGIYVNAYDSRLNSRNGFPVFSTVIEANHILKIKDMYTSSYLTDEDKKNIKEWSQKPDIWDIICHSIAPSIHGHHNIKQALALALFGGTAKNADKGRHKLRGDINILVLGDPGTAKSQFLKYCEKTAPRAVYATGKGASAVGLTASVRKDPLTREWTMEGGALVLADKGMALIDEFDKMNDHDRTSIHEAMEQQTISISKAGINCQLEARCAVVAAANPVNGRYDSAHTFVDNVDLTDPIISRFDVLCVVRDLVDPNEDERLASFVIRSHMRSHPKHPKQKKEDPPQELDPAQKLEEPEDDFDWVKEVDRQEALRKQQQGVTETMDQDMLRKYILYARQNFSPTISTGPDGIEKEKIISLYTDLRKHSMREGAIPIGVRHIESIIRMSEARAKLCMRPNVTNLDVDVAVSIAVNSFVDTQKFSVRRSMKNLFKKYLYSPRDFDSLLRYKLHELMRNEELMNATRIAGEPENSYIRVKDFVEEAAALETPNPTEFFKTAMFATEFRLTGTSSHLMNKHIRRVSSLRDTATQQMDVEAQGDTDDAMMDDE